MSRGLKKLLALCLVAVMLTAVIAGCGQKTEDPAGDDPVQQDPVEQPTQPEPEEEEPEPEEVRDLSGRVIRVAAWWDMTPQGGTPGGDRQVARREEMEQKYNFTFEYVNIPWDQTVETYSSSVMAGDPFAEIATLEDNWVIGLANSGFCTELDPLFDFNQDKWDQMAKTLSTVNGKTYGMGTGHWWPRGMFFYNKNIFEREGLENPYELMKKGEWTWEKMEELARKATKDTDNDGVIDQWGLAGMDMDIAMVVANGAELASIVDGQAKLNFREPLFWKHSTHIRDSVRKVSVISILLMRYPGIWQPNIQRRKSCNVLVSYWKVDDFRDNMADDYGLVMPPIGPNAEKNITPTRSQLPDYPKNTKTSKILHSSGTSGQSRSPKIWRILMHGRSRTSTMYATRSPSKCWLTCMRTTVVSLLACSLLYSLLLKHGGAVRTTC